MAKAVFRPGEVTLVKDKVAILSPTSYADLAHLAQTEELEPVEDIVEEYTGPTVEDIRREADEFRAQWEIEREAMVRSARTEADGIIKEAEQAAFQEVKRKTDEAQSFKRQAQDEAEKIIAEARQKAKEIEESSRLAFEAERKEAAEAGRAAGRETGFIEGRDEVNRLVQRIQTVLERAQDKRAEILAETEKEIINLVLLISRKVIMVISENQRNVIISNVVQALRK
ncbi:MAG: FliH/SctL family protein, partial [Treponema sp.]|nr:FliH/SctL family protein [Treponema sp.]